MTKTKQKARDLRREARKLQSMLRDMELTERRYRKLLARYEQKPRAHGQAAAERLRVQLADIATRLARGRKILESMSEAADYWEALAKR